MWRRASDTPFERDSASTFLPWIIAVMVFLSALAVTGGLLLGDALEGWSRGLTGTLTVQIPNEVDGEPVSDEEVERVAGALRATAGVVRVRIIPVPEVREMVRPWLGEAADQEDLPLPRLIDVGLAEDADVDLGDLRERVSGVVPGTTIEDHQQWLRQLADIARASLVLSLAVVGMIVFATVITIVFATRTGLKVHARVTEVLHLIGAPDRYIARQFERQAFWLGFRGALIGSALAAAAVYALGHLVGRVEAFNLSALSLTPWEWAVFGIFPVAAAIVARITARITVLRTLARKP